MQVVLTKRVPKLGQEHELVTVRSGFARNFLLPNGLAMLATPDIIKRTEKKREAMLKAIAEKIEMAKGLADKLSGMVLTFKKKVKGEKLYAALHEKDIVEALAAEKIEVEKDQIKFKEAIKELGDYKVTVLLADGVKTDVKVKVEKE
jgi:large subunit ribosomal protein L9